MDKNYALDQGLLVLIAWVSGALPFMNPPRENIICVALFKLSTGTGQAYKTDYQNMIDGVLWLDRMIAFYAFLRRLDQNNG